MMSILLVIAPALCLLLLLSILAAPVGSLMLWRKTYFFAEAFAHASVLGLCVALVADMPYWLGGIIAVAIVLLAMRLLTTVRLPTSTILMMIATSSLALVAVWVSYNPILQKRLTGLLFGDVLLTSWQDVAIAAILVALSASLLWRYRYQQLKMSLDNKLAEAEGVNTQRQHWVFMLALAAFTVFGVQSIGALLTSSLLLIPSMAARLWALSPWQMMVYAWLMVVLSIIVGMAVSVAVDLPSGACIVCTMGVLYIVSRLLKSNAATY